MTNKISKMAIKWTSYNGRIFSLDDVILTMLVIEMILIYINKITLMEFPAQRVQATINVSMDYKQSCEKIRIN